MSKEKVIRVNNVWRFSMLEVEQQFDEFQH